jgi:hypothetical protein
MSTQDTRDHLPVIAGSRFGRQAEAPGAGACHHDPRLDRLIEYLPERWRSTAHWLREPASRWARIPFGILFLIGGFLAFLPILGLWMLPVGLILLAEDVSALRRLRARMLDWAERRWPHIFAQPKAQSSDKEETT